MTETLPRRTEREGNTGGSNCTGLPHPSLQYRVSNWIPSTLTMCEIYMFLRISSTHMYFAQLYTSSYDCTIRSLSFVSGTSKEVYASENGNLISCIDLPATGQEIWMADASGGVTHIDLREEKSSARRYELSEVKIGSISVNPTRTNFLLTASNSRFLK